MSKVKCIACHKTSHYTSQCPHKEEEAHVAASVEIDDFAEKFEKEFSLVSCLSSSSFGEYEDIGAWIVDNGSSRHMTGMRSMFLSVFRRQT
jgi:hypothetical protein